MSIANCFKAFDIPFALTGGGPGGSTQTIALDIYNDAFGSFQIRICIGKVSYPVSNGSSSNSCTALDNKKEGGSGMKEEKKEADGKA